MAHFFRIIGKNNILVIKGILDRERKDIEDITKAFYLWSQNTPCPDSSINLEISIDKLYEYAGFFLNTIGGRAYLFRRDSRSRLLANYYSVLIIDTANEKQRNRYGISLVQVIPPLIGEIEGSTQLIYKERYLDNLYDLLEKYQ